MKINRIAKLSLAALLIAAIGAFAWADFFEPAHGGAVFMTDEFNVPVPPPGVPHMPFAAHGPGPGDPFHLMMLVDVLDLDKEQRKRVGVVMDALMPKMREVLFSLSDSRKALEEVFEGQVSDDKQLRKLADEQGRLTAEMLYLHMKARADLRAVLTEEQLEKLEGFPAGHGARRFMKHRGRFHDSGERSRTEP